MTDNTALVETISTMAQSATKVVKAFKALRQIMVHRQISEGTTEMDNLRAGLISFGAMAKSLLAMKDLHISFQQLLFGLRPINGERIKGESGLKKGFAVNKFNLQVVVNAWQDLESSTLHKIASDVERIEYILVPEGYYGKKPLVIRTAQWYREFDELRRRINVKIQDLYDEMHEGEVPEDAIKAISRLTRQFDHVATKLFNDLDGFISGTAKSLDRGIDLLAAEDSYDQV